MLGIDAPVGDIFRQIVKEMADIVQQRRDDEGVAGLLLLGEQGRLEAMGVHRDALAIAHLALAPVELDDLPEDIADRGVDTEHESIASAWLSQYFAPAVSEPVRLHVAAKRYLCATEPGYFGELSPASVQSLALQGGPMSPEEVASFAAEPFAEAAVRLRRWDDFAKRTDLPTPDFTHYRPIIEAALKRRG